MSDETSSPDALSRRRALRGGLAVGAGIVTMVLPSPASAASVVDGAAVTTTSTTSTVPAGYDPNAAPDPGMAAIDAVPIVDANNNSIDVSGTDTVG